MAAAYYGRLEAAQEILRHSPEVNAKNKKGATPLHNSITGQTNNQEMLLLLLPARFPGELPAAAAAESALPGDGME